MFKYIIATLICVTSTCCADLAIEDTICSPKQCYVVKEVMGQGAFGRVYKIQDPKGKIYALKTYLSSSEDGGNSFWDLLGNTKREYQRGRTLNHPNIIKSIEYFTDSSDPYDEKANIVLQFVDGYPLWQIYGHALQYNKVRAASHHFIDAMLHGLSVNLFHLDLHGGNIMFTKAQDVMVIDLASFFTIEEMLNFKAKKALADPVQQTLSLEDVKEQKLKKFFANHPDLLEKLQEHEEEQEIHADVVVQKGKAPRMPKINQKQNVIYSNYFSDIANMCIQFLDTSDLSFNKKDAIVDKINSLQNEYSNLVSNKKIVDPKVYFEKLKKAIN